MLYQDAFLRTLEAGLRTLLPRWGLAEAAPLTLLNISENATYLAHDAAGDRRIVLRVHRPGYHTQAEILSELDWIDALRHSGSVETPCPLRPLDGSAFCSFADHAGHYQVAAFSHMSGVQPQGGDLPKWFARLGAVNARLHSQSRAWVRPPGFVRKTWNFETTVGLHAYWGDWRQALGLDAAGHAIVARVLTLLKAETDRYSALPDRFGLIHCDMRLANLLVDGDRLGVIDFDDCGFSWYAYDFAAAVSFLEHEPFLPDLLAAWAAGYRSAAPLAKEDEAALPMFVMLRRIQLTAWVASHAETPGAAAMGAPYTAGTVMLAERYLTKNG